jgi:hypothetical protein
MHLIIVSERLPLMASFKEGNPEIKVGVNYAPPMSETTNLASRKYLLQKRDIKFAGPASRLCSEQGDISCA